MMEDALKLIDGIFKDGVFCVEVKVVVFTIKFSSCFLVDSVISICVDVVKVEGSTTFTVEFAVDNQVVMFDIMFGVEDIGVERIMFFSVVLGVDVLAIGWTVESAVVGGVCLFVVKENDVFFVVFDTDI